MYPFGRRITRLTFVNTLTFSRLLAGMLMVFVFNANQHEFALIMLISYIWLTDTLDGILGRKWEVTTKAGAIFDYVVDRFNYYLVIFLLIHIGVSPFLVFPFLLRDLMYISTQIYIGIPSIQGTKAASFAGTAAGYLYLLIFKFLNKRSLILDVGLFLTLCMSLANLVLRIFRLRYRLIGQLKQDLALGVNASHLEEHTKNDESYKSQVISDKDT